LKRHLSVPVVTNHDGIAFKRVTKAIGIGGLIFGMISPSHLQIGDVLAVDLVQSGITGAAIIAMRALPSQKRLSFWIAVGRRQFLRPGGRDGLVKRQFFPRLRILDRPVILIGGKGRRRGRQGGG
jgi:hypothetical protein